MTTGLNLHIDNCVVFGYYNKNNKLDYESIL